MSLEAAPEAHSHGQSYVPNDKGKQKEVPRKRQRLMGRDSTARDAVFEELTELGYADALKSLQSTGCMDQQHDEIRPKPLLLLSHDIVVDCPPLSTTRGIPHLVAQSLEVTPTRQESSAAPTSALRKNRAFTLPLPAHLASNSYSFGSATLLDKCHHTGRYFLAYFPRLSPTTTSKCMAAALSAQRMPSGPNRKDPITELLSSRGDIENGQEDNEDLGGCVVLYTKPKANLATAGVPIYSHTYEVHSWYNVQAEAMQCLWLYPPRKWVALDDSNQETSDDLMGDPMNGVTEGRPPMVDRLPPHGPRPPIAINEASPPSFLILFADHWISLYFPSMQTLTARPGVQEADRNLRLLSSSLLVPNVVTCDQLAPIDMAMRPELGSGVQPTPVAGIGLAPRSTNQVSTRRVRWRQATMSLRADDESIWIAYQSTVRERFRSASSITSAAALLPADDPMGLLNMPGILPTFDQAAAGGIHLLRPEQPMFGGGSDEQSLANMDRPSRDVDEDWVDLVEVRVDLLSPVATLQVNPQPRIPFPEPRFDSALAQAMQASYTLQGVAFAEPSGSEGACSNEAVPSDPPDLGLLLMYRRWRAGNHRTILQLLTLQDTRLTLSEALGSLGQGAGGGRKAMMEAEPRYEWLPRHRREAELEECVSLVEARESTLRGRVWVKKASGRLGVLDCKTLQIRDSGILLDNQASGYVFSLGTNRFLTAALQLRQLRSQDLAPHTEGSSRFLAAQAAASLLENSEDLYRARTLLKRTRLEEIDPVLDVIWETLETQGSAQTFIEDPDAGIPILKLQFSMYRNAKDPREAVARDLIQLVAVQKAFEACATRIKIPQANGMKGARPPQFIPRYYDIDSLWFLIAQLEWFLQYLRVALQQAVTARSAFKRSTKDSHPQDAPSALFALLHPFGRSRIMSVISHIISFEKFITSLRRPISLPQQVASRDQFVFQPMTIDGRDATATALAKEIVRDRLDASGLSLAGLNHALRQMDVLTTRPNGAVDVDMDESHSHEPPLRHTSLLHCRIPLTSDVTKAIEDLGSNTDIVHTSQVDLFFNRTLDGLSPLEHVQRDIITKEPIRVSATLGPAKRCGTCGGLTACRSPVMLGGNVRDCAHVRWLQRWSEKCICGGAWVPA